MKNCIFAFLAIIGTVIGSGFISGKEIVVFFSRFGWFSFPCIVLAFFLFFFLFKFVLERGTQAIKRLENSKICFWLNIVLCLIFSSAMFAGIGNLLVFDVKIVNYLLFFLIIFFWQQPVLSLRLLLRCERLCSSGMPRQEGSDL